MKQKKGNQNNVAACVIEESKQQLQQHFWKKATKAEFHFDRKYMETCQWQEIDGKS